MGQGEVTVATLGPVVLMRGDRAVATRSALLRTVLALLAMEPGVSMSSDKLIDELWGDDTPADARAALQVVVSRLRKWASEAGVPGGCVRFEHGGYHLELPRDAIDLARFGDGLNAADRERDPAKRLAICEQALGLWRSEPFSGCAGSVSLEIEAARLSDARLQLLEWRAEAECDLGQYPRALADLAVLVKEHPARERFTWLTMVALYRQGRQREALAAYESTRRRLAEEFGLDPSPDLVELEAKILAQAPGLAEPAGGEVIVPRPTQRTRPLLVGRESELEALGRTLRAGSPKRMVVLKGSAGAGKSTLLEALCHDMAREGTVVVTGRFDGGPSPLSGWAAALASLGIDLEEAAASGAIATAQSVANRIAAKAGSPQLLVALEDIHLADTASLSLFVEIARAGVPDGASVVATARDPDLLPRPAWSAALANASLTAQVEEMPLSELAAEHVRTVAEMRLGHFGREAIPRLATLIWNRTGGHPLHMSALIETMAAEPDLDKGLAAGQRVPSSLLPLFVHQLGTLPDPCQELVEALAVIGPAPVERVAAVCGTPAAVAARELQPAIKLGVVAYRGDRFDLRHALIRDAVIDRMPESTVMHLNMAALLDLEARGGDPFEELRFASGAGSLLSAERLGLSKLAAGKVAYQRGAMAEAEHLLSGARAILSGVEQSEACVFLGLTMAELGRDSESDDLLDEAVEREPELDLDLQILAVTGERLGMRGVGSERELVRAEMVERRTRHLRDRRRALLLSRLLQLQTVVVGPPFDMGMLDEIEQVSRELEDPELALMAIVVREYMGQVIDPTARLSAAENYYQASTFADDVSSRIRSTRSLLWACVITGQTERARDLLWELRRLDDRTGRRYARWFAGTLEAALLVASGNGDAEARAHVALELGLQTGIADALGTYGVHLVFSNWLAGTLGSISPVIEQAMATYPRIVAWRAVAAAADLQAGDRLSAAVRLRDYLDHRLDSAGLLFNLPALCVAATVAVGLGDEQAVRAVLTALPQDSDEFAVVGAGPAAIAGPVRLFTGLLRLSLGDTEPAAKDLAAAEELSEYAGWIPWVAACRYVRETFVERPGAKTDVHGGPFPLGLTPPMATRPS